MTIPGLVENVTAIEKLLGQSRSKVEKEKQILHMDVSLCAFAWKNCDMASSFLRALSATQSLP